MKFDANQLLSILPMIILIGMGCVVLLAETFVEGPTKSRQGLAWLGVGSFVASGLALSSQWAEAGQVTSLFDGMLVVDRLSLFLDGAFLFTGAVTLLIAQPFMEEHGFEFGEFYSLVIFTVAGMMMVVHASHLLSLLVGIETMSLGAYVLTGCWRRNVRSSEGAMKYFLVGAFATGFLVYGMALVYGSSKGALSYTAIGAAAGAASASPLFLVGLYFILIALVFKIAAVPFHMWAPDAYEGAPTPVTGFMAAGVKAAAFGAILRLFSAAFGSPMLATQGVGWVHVVSVLAALTMTLGNIAALRQENVKRMLAYSSIAHAGYILVGVAAMGMGVASAQPAVLFYLVAYTVTTLGTFGVVAWAGRRNEERLFVDDWSGMAVARPAVALAMAIFLLSLGGVPPTGGFFGKFYLFRSAMESPALIWLVVLGVLNSVVSVFYYLRIVVAMYFRDAVRPHDNPFRAPTMTVALLVTAVLVVVLGVFPSSVIDWAGGAIVAAVKVAGQ